MSKRIDNKTFEKFVQDVKPLRSVYTDAKIAALMKTNPGNFSSRINGSKRPGQDFIDAFYQAWGTKLAELVEKARMGEEKMGSLEEMREKPRKWDELIQLYREIGVRLARVEAFLFRLENKENQNIKK
jgi:hypothetical protein